MSPRVALEEALDVDAVDRPSDAQAVLALVGLGGQARQAAPRAPSAAPQRYERRRRAPRRGVGPAEQEAKATHRTRVRSGADHARPHHRRRRLHRVQHCPRARGAASRLGGRRARQPLPARLGAQPPAPARRPGSSSSTATCASSTTCCASAPIDALVECSAEPSVLAGSGDVRLRRPTNLMGAYHCLELAARARRAGRLPLDQPRLPGRRARAAGLERGRDALRARRRAAAARRLGRGHHRGASRWTGARTLYGATKLAAELLIAEYDELGRCGDQPLRRDRRAVADGQGRPGRLHPLDARPPLRPRRSATSATAAAASRCATCCTSTTSSTSSSEQLGDPSTGPGRRSTSAAAGAVACRCWRPRRFAASSPGNERADRARSARPGPATSVLPLGLHGAVRAHRLAPASRAPARCSPTSTPGSPSTKTLVRSRTRLGTPYAHRHRHRLGRPDRLRVRPLLRRSRASTSSASTTTCGPTSSAPRPRRAASSARLADELDELPRPSSSTSATARRVDALFAEHGSEIELVVHTAAQPSHDWAAREPHTDFSVNANGTLNLLEAAREQLPRRDVRLHLDQQGLRRPPQRAAAGRARHALRAARGPQAGSAASTWRCRSTSARTRCSAPRRWRPTCSCRSTGATSTCRPSASAAAASPAPSTPAPSCTASSPT